MMKSTENFCNLFKKCFQKQHFVLFFCHFCSNLEFPFWFSLLELRMSQISRVCLAAITRSRTGRGDVGCRWSLGAGGGGSRVALCCWRRKHTTTSPSNLGSEQEAEQWLRDGGGSSQTSHGGVHGMLSPPSHTVSLHCLITLMCFPHQPPTWRGFPSKQEHILHQLTAEV